MSVTAQEFRDAAARRGIQSAWYRSVGRNDNASECDEDVRLFLAAAEQAEQFAAWRTWGIAEIAIRNPNVASYVEHWERRALKAEEQVATLTAERDEARAKIDAVKAWLEDYSTTHYVSTAGKFVALKAILSDEAKAAK